MNPSTPTITTLAQALALAREQLQAQPLPDAWAAQLQARVKTAHAPRQQTTSRAWWGAAACALLLVGSVILMVGGPTGSGTDLPAVSGDAGLAGFMPLVPEEDWPRGNAPAWLVDTELRRDRLVSLGLPFDPSHAGDSVRAELLVRPSGEVLAVRFLQ